MQDTKISNMAFLDELENMFFGNNTGTPSMDVLMRLANESGNLTLSPTILDESGNRVLREVILLVAYGVLIATSLFGNSLVCHVVLRNKRMHTVTNFFIANLAVADLLLTCINVPFNIARNLLDDWPFGNAMCHLLNFSLMVSVYVSTFTLLGIALDRQQVLLYPLSPRISKPLGLVILSLIWVVAICLSLPFGIYNKLQTVDFLVFKVQRCTSSFPDPSEKWEKYLTIFTLSLQYIIPLTVIAITYGRIVRKLWVRTHVGAVTQNQQLSQQKAKRKSIKMLICVVVVFAVCWMPLNLYQMLADFHPNVQVFHYNSTVFFICHWIAISSTCYNPFVYCWLNETFRNEVKRRFKCCFKRPKRVHPGRDMAGTILKSENGLSFRRNSTVIGQYSRCPQTLSMDEYISPTKEQAEFLTEFMESPNSDTSLSGFTMSGLSIPLETVPEISEHFTEMNEHENISDSHPQRLDVGDIHVDTN